MTDKIEVEFFRCHVRHGGYIGHTIPKPRVSQRELRLLKEIHGGDAVVDVRAVDIVEMTRDDVREHDMQLAREYGKKRVEDALGVSLERFDEWLLSKLEEEGEVREQKQVAREEAEAKRVQQSAAPAKGLVPA